MRTIASFVSVFVLLLAIPLAKKLMARAQPQTATVHVVSMMWNGTEFGKVDVQSFRSIEGIDPKSSRNVEGKELKSLFAGGTAPKVPYGEYDLTAGLEGFYPDKRAVQVAQSEVWVVVEPELPDGDTVGFGPNFIVKGSVKNAYPGDEPIFVRLVGVYTAYTGDTKVQMSGNAGTFILSANVPFGRYVLITTGRRGVLDTRYINSEYTSRPEVEIDLDEVRVPHVE